MHRSGPQLGHGRRFAQKPEPRPKLKHRFQMRAALLRLQDSELPPTKFRDEAPGFKIRGRTCVRIGNLRSDICPHVVGGEESSEVGEQFQETDGRTGDLVYPRSRQTRKRFRKVARPLS